MANGMAGAREAALYVLARCRRFDAWSQQTIQTAAEKFSLDERDTALCTKLCLDVLQNAALCDYYIGCYSSVPAAKLEPNLLDILRLGVCQLLFMDKIPVSAAVNEAVEQTKRSGSRAAGLVNAVLRRVAENRETSRRSQTSEQRRSSPSGSATRCGSVSGWFPSLAMTGRTPFSRQTTARRSSQSR